MRRSVLLALLWGTFSTGCLDYERNALRDVDAVVRELRDSGVPAKIAIANSTEEAERIWRSNQDRADLSLVVVAPDRVDVRYAPALERAFPDPPRAKRWGEQFLAAGPARSARAAARGLLLDLMEAGVVPPRPLAPLPPEPDMGDVGPHQRPRQFAAAVAATILVAACLRILARRRRRASTPAQAEDPPAAGPAETSG